MDQIVSDYGWLKVKKSEKGYYFSERKGKDSIAVFLVRQIIEDGNSFFEVLVRKQPLPIDNSKDMKLFNCPITGSIDEGEDIRSCAIREIEEETGYLISSEKINPLGSYIVGTQTNETVYMFMTWIKDKTPKVEAEGNGNYFEGISKNE